MSIESDPAPTEHAATLMDELRLATLELLDEGVWIRTIDGRQHYRNAIAAAMEGGRWTRAGVSGNMDTVVFNAQTLILLRTRGRHSAEYSLSPPADQALPDTHIALEMQVLNDARGEQIGLAFHARDTSREWRREQTLQDRNVELLDAYSRLKQTQTKLLQAEKMASIGQLAAGVAHEINNPIGYVHSNLGTLQTYVRGILSLIDAYDELVRSLPDAPPVLLQAVEETKAQIDYRFMIDDLPQLLAESREGIERVKKIVLDLRDFSRGGQGEVEEWGFADLHRGLESTMNIVWNELKYKAEVTRDFCELPPIECIPSQLNQVFLNLLVNAGQAIKDRGVIAVKTTRTDDEVCISVSDSGSGIAPEHLGRIFDPFFTTKPVGSGTGLGLALSYGIVQKHEGRIEVSSEVGVGTTFRIYIPLRRRTVTAV